MMRFQSLVILLLFILILQEIQGSSPEDNLYLHFDTVCDPGTDDATIYWGKEGPSHEAPQPQPQPQPPPITETSTATISLEEISKKLVDFHHVGKLEWPELRDSSVKGWNEFCLTLWKIWKINLPHFEPYCLHQLYFGIDRKHGLAVKVLDGTKLTGDLLICDCEDRSQKILKYRYSYFYVTRGNMKEYFILEKEQHNTRSKSLIPVYYVGLP